MINQRLALLQRQSEIMDDHCTTCKQKSSNSNRYCVDSCEVGKELKSIGNQLLGLSNRKKEMKLGMAMNIGNCAKLKYLAETYPFLKQKDMANILGVAASQISSSLKSTNYKNSKPDMSIQEHVQNYMKKYYPEKMAGEVIVTKTDEQQVIKSTSEHVSIEKYQAMKNSWKRLAAEKDKEIQELKLQLSVASTLTDINSNGAEDFREKFEEQVEKTISWKAAAQKLETELNHEIEQNKLQKAQYVSLSEQYKTVEAAFKDSEKEKLELSHQLEALKGNSNFAMKEEDSRQKGELAKLQLALEQQGEINEKLKQKIKYVQSTEKLTSMLLALKIQECL
ncbi:zinc-finger domain-containing protein [Schinkia azotoformans]|uniref:Zinc-finger domain-containing protein n=1 Tax=Schinkia azotoformans LMG 9581 TaxID=1131731 RepID=K6DIB0_SCHAZ|nr:zinc-finger domain-containing protein [Schinkia azotoformans]EKN67858.1 hypothetical protein BAZO_08249 [Schinkia azotoformans LMG 9581]MEC1637377.1 zinc-finger domain-containing protein [Schinkia azotoformans]MEC1943781.1 zinc-finger domain-containing protein [Schinkia azotoformans]